MLLYQANPVEVELFSYNNESFFKRILVCN